MILVFRCIAESQGISGGGGQKKKPIIPNPVLKNFILVLHSSIQIEYLGIESSKMFLKCLKGNFDVEPRLKFTVLPSMHKIGSLCFYIAQFLKTLDKLMPFTRDQKCSQTKN